MSLKLTVVDQSPVQLGTAGPEQAPLLSAKLAQACDTWGYSRYWLSEHHNSNSFAGPCPEVLISHIASITKNIRVGSGGVMLANHNPYKVAEQFRMLETLFPNRIDLGIGRAPGGDNIASQALAYPYQPTHGERYAEQTQLLCGFLRDGFPANHAFSELKVMPSDEPCPELWMLGTSGGSAAFAGQMGFNMSLGLFISPDKQTVAIMDEYKNAYQQSGHKGMGQTMITIAALCAPSREEALYHVAPQAYWKVMAFRHGIRQPWLSPEEALNGVKRLSISDQSYYQSLIESVTLGSPQECVSQLEQVSQYWQTNEIGLVSVTHDFESRKHSFELLAKALLA